MMRLTVLVENTANKSGLLAEHGLSLWLEVGSRRILFDTGQTDIVCRNADVLGIDLGDADALVLSHGHYDHTGGLAAVLKRTVGLEVHAHPAALENRYTPNADGTARSIAIPDACKQALLDAASLIPTEGPVDLGDGLLLTGPIPRTNDFEDTGGDFFLDAKCLIPDPILDDQALCFDSSSGVAVILGCAHAGIVNTLRRVQELLPGRPIRTVLGGTHLVHADEARMDRTVDALRELDVRRIFPLHCTGFAAAARLWRDIPGRVALCPVGSTVDL